MYTLFKGFKKISEHPTISDAKKNAPKEDGVYNLIGKDYRFSWQIIDGILYNECN